MNRKTMKKISIYIFVVLLGATFVLSGCQTAQEKNDGKEATKGSINLAYGNWAEGIAMTNLVKAILEDKMNYDEVKMTLSDPGLIYTSLANSDVDVFLDSWLPVTHESYMEQYGDQMDDLGTNFEGARIGLVVPAYMEISSIEELNDIKEDLNGEIVGIGPGTGLMKHTNEALDIYNLDYDLMEASGPVMTAALADAIDDKEPVVVTGWAPHWKFARYDLKFLEDPKGVYGEAENIHTITRKGLEEEDPELGQFLRNFKLNDQQLGDLMGKIADSDEEPIVVAREWMQNNEELINSWLPQE